MALRCQSSLTVVPSTQTIAVIDSLRPIKVWFTSANMRYLSTCIESKIMMMNALVYCAHAMNMWLMYRYIYTSYIHIYYTHIHTYCIVGNFHRWSIFTIFAGLIFTDARTHSHYVPHNWAYFAGLFFSVRRPRKLDPSKISHYMVHRYFEYCFYGSLVYIRGLLGLVLNY